MKKNFRQSRLGFLPLKIVIVTLCCCCWFIFGQTQGREKNEARKFSPGALKGDLDHLYKGFAAAHPGFYRHTQKKVLDKAFDKVRESLTEKMTAREFYDMLLPLVNQIGDGHTIFELPSYEYNDFWTQSQTAIPLEIRYIREKIYVTQNFGADSTLAPGSELIAINGKGILKIFRELGQNILTDGRIQTGKWDQVEKMFPMMYAFHIGQPDSFVVEFIRPGGRVPESVLLDPIAFSGGDDYITTFKIARVDENKSLDLTFVHNDTTAILTIPHFVEYWYDEQQIDFLKWIDDAFREINRRGSFSVILDLRDNPGGKSEFAARLFGYLSPDSTYRFWDRVELATNQKVDFLSYADNDFFPGYPEEGIEKSGKSFIWTKHPCTQEMTWPENRFRGDMYALINRGTHSAAAEFAAMLHNTGRVELAGEETGGGYYGSGNTFYAKLTLPSTKLEVAVPLAAIYMNVGFNSLRDRGVFPDHLVPKEINAVLQGRDSVLEYLLSIMPY